METASARLLVQNPYSRECPRVELSGEALRSIVAAAIAGHAALFPREQIGYLLGRRHEWGFAVEAATTYEGGTRRRARVRVPLGAVLRQARREGSARRLRYLGLFHTHLGHAPAASAGDKESFRADPCSAVHVIAAVWKGGAPNGERREVLVVTSDPYRLRLASHISGRGGIPTFAPGHSG